MLPQMMRRRPSQLVTEINTALIYDWYTYETYDNYQYQD